MNSLDFYPFSKVPDNKSKCDDTNKVLSQNLKKERKKKYVCQNKLLVIITFNLIIKERLKWVEIEVSFEYEMYFGFSEWNF